VNLKKLEKLKSIVEDFNNKYNDYHLVSYNSDNMNQDMKKALRMFSKVEGLDSGSPEDVLFIDTKVYSEEIKSLTDMDFAEFYLVVRDKEPLKTYPLIGESLRIILEYGTIEEN
jgi:hypothetical protein